jgi:predicted pyridoxine 5'-phosphate oxidase superfamily flavin-nucleotide-binding protein
MGILTEEMKKVVRYQRLGYVATISPDGAPSLSPKGSLTVWDDDHLVFADIESPRTIRNLGANSKTEVNVVDPFTRKGFRFRGTGTVLRSGGDYWKAVELYKADGADIRRIRAIVLIKVLETTVLSSPVYLLGLDEAEVRRIWEEYHVKSMAKTVIDLIPPNDF